MPVPSHADVSKASFVPAEDISAGMDTRNPGDLVHGGATQVS